MAHQPSQIQLSIASPAEIERTARSLMAMRDGYITTGTLAEFVPRRLILQSWQRCQAMQVNPGTRIATLAIEHETELQDILEANTLLIRAASPVMSYLIDFFADSGYAVVLSDARGCLLQVVGDAAIIRRLARIDFVPGGKWSEDAAGTNAIGTTLADGHVVQLMAAEHFCDGWQDLTCTATPIRHPTTGDIIGVLNVTGNYRLIRPFLTSFLATSALEIQQELRLLLATHAIGKTGNTLSLSANKTLVYVRPHTAFAPAVEEREKGGSNANNDVYQFPQSAAGNEPLLAVPTLDNALHEYEQDVRLQLDQQKLRANDAERLARAAGIISTSLDSQIALDVIAEQVAYLLFLEGAAVALFNAMNEDVSLHIWSKRRSGWLEPVQRLTELFQTAREAVSLIRERGELLIVDDVLTSAILPVSFSTQMDIAAIALLPLVTARGVIGFLIAPKRAPYHWGVNDVRLGLALASQAATAIENARLFSSLQLHNRRIELLNTVAQCLNMLPDPNQCLDLALESILTEMNLDVGMVFLCDAQRGKLIPVASNDLSGSGYKVQDEPCFQCFDGFSLIVTSGESLLVRDVERREYGANEEVYADWHTYAQAMHLCELMAVPLAARTINIGVLLVGSRTMRGLTEDDLALCTTIGQQLGLNLKNAQLLRSMSEIEALREADQLKSGFLAAVSHDLRSPLTAIRTSVESLLDSGASSSRVEQEHLLHNIAGQTSRLGQLVDQLLDLSRIEAGALPLDCDWTDLPVLIADTIGQFEQLNTDCSVMYELPKDLPLHYIDPTRFVQVIWNLLENAHKYDPSHATIKVEVERGEATSNESIIMVSDRGPGIPAEEHEKIFQRFYRLNRDKRAHTQSSGLGLAICRGIVEAHGGRIWVEDRPGGGSKFCIALPLLEIAQIGYEAIE